MPNFRSEIHKIANGRKFSNDYVLVAASIGDAAALASDWASLEQSLMANFVTFLDIRTSTLVKGDRVFIHTVLNFTGSKNVSPTIALPAYCCVRLDFPTPASDAGHKYYRHAINENDQGMGIIAPDSIAALQATVDSHLTNNPDMLAGLRIGKNLSAAGHPTIFQFVQERQEHRRKKKKVVVAGGTGV